MPTLRCLGEVLGQLSGISSLFPLCGKRTPNSGQVLPQVVWSHPMDPSDLFSKAVMAWLFLRTPMFSHDRAPKMNQNKSFLVWPGEPMRFGSRAQVRVACRGTRKSTKTATLELPTPTYWQLKELPTPATVCCLYNLGKGALQSFMSSMSPVGLAFPSRTITVQKKCLNLT